MTRDHTTLLLDTLGVETAPLLHAALASAPGVIRVYVDCATEAVFVEHCRDRISPADLARIVERLGVRVRPAPFTASR